MNTIITLTYDGRLSRKEQAYLAQMLADALDDFQKARGPTPEDYLLRRYQQNSTMPLTVDHIEYKLEELKTRIGLAGKLHNAALAATIAEVQKVPELCSYCDEPATIHRHDYPDDTRKLCEECDSKAKPEGQWTFHPETKPERRR